MTMKEALEKTDTSVDGLPWIYLYGEQEAGQPAIIFYVGQSAQPFERLQQHLGRGEDRRSSPFPDVIGEFILENQPVSLTWFVQVFGLAEMRAELKQERLSINEAERVLIAHLKPCLNRVWNKYPTPLPLRYIRDLDIANEGVLLE